MNPHESANFSLDEQHPMTDRPADRDEREVVARIIDPICTPYSIDGRRAREKADRILAALSRPEPAVGEGLREALTAIAENDQTDCGRIWSPRLECWVGVRQFAQAALSPGCSGGQPT